MAIAAGSVDDVEGGLEVADGHLSELLQYNVAILVLLELEGNAIALGHEEVKDALVVDLVDADGQREVRVSLGNL